MNRVIIFLNSIYHLNRFFTLSKILLASHKPDSDPGTKEYAGSDPVGGTSSAHMNSGDRSSTKRITKAKMHYWIRASPSDFAGETPKPRRYDEIFLL